MKESIDLTLSTSVKRDSALKIDLTIRSRDIHNSAFMLTFVDGQNKPLELDDTFTVEVLSVFTKEQVQSLTSATIYANYAHWEFDTSLISGDDTVFNYVYIKKDGVPIVSADANAFYFNVGLSKIDENAGRIAESYDENYEKVLHEFELKINLTAEEWAQMADETREFVEQIKDVTVDEFVELKMGEELANLEANYATRLTGLESNDANLTAQLAQTDKNAGEGYAKTWSLRNVTDTEPPAYLTVVDDDGGIEVLSKLKPIADDLGIPMTVAAIVDNQGTNPTQELSVSQLLDLQADGWEIASHSVTHRNLRDLTEEELDYEMRYSKQYFTERGLKVRNFVAPFGSNDAPKVRVAASKYYNCTPAVGGAMNVFPLKNHLISRVALGSYTAGGKNTLAYYKSKVDEAIEKGGWLIFMTHVWSPDHDETQNLYLRQTLEYAQSKNVAIVNLQEGYEKFGNILEIEGQMSIGNNGTISSPSANQVVSNLREISKETPPSYFNTNFANEVVTSRMWAETSPGSGSYNHDGIMVTYAIGSLAEYYQVHYPYRQNKILKRHTIGNGSTTSWTDWIAFEASASLIINNRINGSHYHKNDTPLSSFPTEKITYSKISTASAAGFPSQAGLLMTNRLANENGYDFQEYTTYNSGNKYHRGSNSAGSWLAWKQITMV